MKSSLKIFLAVLAVSTSSFAQNTSTVQVSAQDGYSSRGVRISLVRPNLDYKGTVKYQNFSFDGSGSYDSALGLGIGYVNLPIQELGWTTNLTLMEIKKDSSGNLVRLDGNLGVAVTQFVNLKAGLNVMKITSGSNIDNLNPGLGYQASVGFQINKNLGLDLGYTELNTSGNAPITSNGKEIGQANVTYKISGIEIGLNGTF